MVASSTVLLFPFPLQRTYPVSRVDTQADSLRAYSARLLVAVIEIDCLMPLPKPSRESHLPG